MIGLMHEATPRGFLLINGHSPSAVELARQVGATPREVKAALAELRKNDVYSITADGVPFSRRLIREATRSSAKRRNGAKGAGARWGKGVRRDGEPHGDHDGDTHAEGDGEQHGDTDGEQHGPISHKPEARSPQPPKGLSCYEELAEMAGELLRLYPIVYDRCLSGALYRVREARDFPVAIQLVHDYQPLDRLEAMLEVFLRREDTGKMGKPGSPGQFQYYAPDCDRLLRENGR
jgi:hypothetical protein